MRGANYPAVTDKDIFNALIPLPPLSEQQRIVARIKECMERVEEIEKLRAEAEADRNSLLQALIDAELDGANGGRHAFADVCSIQSALIDPTGTQFLESIHVGGANIESGTGVLLNLKTSREEKLKSSKFPFNSGMVLYNKIRPYLRKVARPEFEGICSADMYPLLPDKQKLLKDYLFYILLSGDFTRYAIQGSNRAGMPKVNREHLFKYVFTLPSIDQQKVICTKLDQAFSAFLSIKQELSTQEQSERLLRDAILRKAFSGEL
jgi:type I restriction enzyme S subunit